MGSPQKKYSTKKKKKRTMVHVCIFLKPMCILPLSTKDKGSIHMGMGNIHIGMGNIHTRRTREIYI